MNKRIKDLLPKPWTFPYPDREMYSREQMEFLAELIIRECVSLCANVECDDELSDYDGGFKDGALLCQQEIKQYFGVE